jgi:hypothetical protein
MRAFYEIGDYTHAKHNLQEMIDTTPESLCSKSLLKSKSKTARSQNLLPFSGKTLVDGIEYKQEAIAVDVKSRFLTVCRSLDNTLYNTIKRVLLHEY